MTLEFTSRDQDARNTESERELLNHIARQLQHSNERIERLLTMATMTNAGLAALTQADADLLTAITANTDATAASTAATTAATNKIANLLQDLAASEDPAVATIAARIEAEVAKINGNNTTIAANTANLAAAIPAPPAPVAA